jgi:Tfp pilus assembly protein PilO
MSEQVLEKEAVMTSAPVVQPSRPKKGMFGLPEIIGLAFSGLLVLITVLAYFYFLLPTQLRLKNLQQERTDLEKSARILNDLVGNNKTKEQRIKEINNSVADFEQKFLRNRATGRMNLYQELNETIRRNNLRNTSGPNYAALDPIDPNAPKTQAAKAGTARWQSLFPGISVSVTVEGPYANVRRFVHDIEANGQFVIINAVQLEGQEGSDSLSAPFSDSEEGAISPTIQPTNSDRKATNIVSLRLDLAIYFQRGGLESGPTQVASK